MPADQKPRERRQVDWDEIQALRLLAAEADLAREAAQQEQAA